jgi:predicted enzyme related to lactoylglutathione lyase
MILSVKTAAVIAMMAIFSSLQLAIAQQETPVPSPGINEQYTMLYYKDMEAPRKFYGGLLGLTSTMDDEWLSLYQVTPSSFIGVIKEAEESWHKVQATNAVMISIVTDDVDAWYERVLADGGVKIVLEIYDNESVPIRAFMMEDPGGYTVEDFQWVQ